MRHAFNLINSIFLVGDSEPVTSNKVVILALWINLRVCTSVKSVGVRVFHKELAEEFLFVGVTKLAPSEVSNVVIQDGCCLVSLCAQLEEFDAVFDPEESGRPRGPIHVTR